MSTFRKKQLSAVTIMHGWVIRRQLSYTSIFHGTTWKILKPRGKTRKNPDFSVKIYPYFKCRTSWKVKVFVYKAGRSTWITPWNLSIFILNSLLGVISVCKILHARRSTNLFNELTSEVTNALPIFINPY